VIKDSLDKSAVPVRGYRDISIGFTADSAGSFILPPVTFSYFDPASGKYQTLHTDSFTVKFTRPGTTDLTEEKKAEHDKSTWLLPVLFLLLTGAVLFYLSRKKKQKTVSVPVSEPSMPLIFLRYWQFSRN
jgi:hypothetical protein